MKTTSVPRQLFLLVLVLASAIVVGSLLFFWMLNRAYEESSRSANAGSAELTRSFTILERVAAAQDSLQRFVRTKDADRLEAALADIEANRRSINDLTAASGAGTFAGIRERYDLAVAAERQVVDAVLKGDVGTANEQFMEAASPRYEAVKAAVREYFQVAQQATASTMARNKARAGRQLLVCLVLANACFLLLLAFVWQMRSRVTRSLGHLSGTLMESADQLAATSSQVTASSQSVSDGVNRQAAALEETSASLEEIGATASQNAGHAQRAKELAAEARVAAETGHHDMREMTEAMAAIKTASGSIAGIIKTIDEIAFQTNLLALNAAVEAARAGQAGLGFAVVADEVRALAQRSATAARETATSVEQVIGKSDRGVDVSAKVARSFGDIVTRVRDVDSLVAEIAVASDQQRSGIEQVSGAMADMEKITQAGAATAEETAATVLELNSQAESLRTVVGELQRMAGDGRSADLTAQLLAGSIRPFTAAEPARN